MLTSGERSCTRIKGLVLLTCFQVEEGIPSGPGADVGEHLERAMVISSLVSGGAFLWGLNLGGGKRVSLGERSGPTKPCSFVGGSQLLGGRESEAEWGRR